MNLFKLPPLSFISSRFLFLPFTLLFVLHPSFISSIDLASGFFPPPPPPPFSTASSSPSTCSPPLPSLLLTYFLDRLRSESPFPTEPCRLAGKGPGIFTPVGAARAYKAIVDAMYNEYSKYDSQAKPTVEGDDSYYSQKIYWNLTAQCGSIDLATNAPELAEDQGYRTIIQQYNYSSLPFSSSSTSSSPSSTDDISILDNFDPIPSIPSPVCLLLYQSSYLIPRSLSVVTSFLSIWKFLLPEGYARDRESFRSFLSQQAGIESGGISETQVDQAALPVKNALINDGFNQAGCYADTSGFYPVNNPYIFYSNVSNPKKDEYVSSFLSSLREPACWAPISSGGPNPPSPLPTSSGQGLFNVFATPHAGFGKPFCASSLSPFYPPALPPASDPAFASLYLDLLPIQSTLEAQGGYRKLLAEYWADQANTTLPPGHWLSIAMDVASQSCYSEWKTIKLLLTVANALYDAGIGAWGVKRIYANARPLTFLPYLLSPSTISKNSHSIASLLSSSPYSSSVVLDPSTNTTRIKKQFAGEYCPPLDLPSSSWRPCQRSEFITPPFSEYPSGHSVFSGAAAEALTLFTGSAYFPVPFSVQINEGESLFEPYCSKANKTKDGRDCVYRKCVVAGQENFDSETYYWPKQTVRLGPWNTYWEAARSAGMSRIYGGIHIMASNIEGQRMGKKIGKAVMEKAQQLFGGGAK